MAALNPKFLRALYLGTYSYGSYANMGIVLRVLWEFWGFCVNGSNDLRIPGGIATSNVTGSYINMPSGFRSSGSILLASGSDGYTIDGSTIFAVSASMPFAPSCVGKWLTLWKSGSTSTDDSIYVIKQWINSSSIYVDPTTGGTSIGISGSVPQLTTRNDVNYRVVDYDAVASLPWASGQSIVFQFDKATDLNPGQAKSQFKIAGYSAYSTNTQLRVQLSPSGTWDGTQFVGESYPEINPEGNTGPGTGGWGTLDWFHTSAGGKGYVTIIAGPSYLICQAGGGDWMYVNGSLLQVEIPRRLYPAANDPNPICATVQGNLPAQHAAQPGYGWAMRWFPSPYDSTLRRWPIMVRGFQGSYWNGTVFGGNSLQYANLTRWPDIFFDLHREKLLLSPAVLSLGTVNGQASLGGQFSLARAEVLTTRYIPSGYPKYMRVGDNNDRWIHIGGGIMLPWDHALVTSRDLFGGTT